jgi:hypothetical protein
MKDKINEAVLCVLKYKDNEIVIDYEIIENHFVQELEALTKLCETSSDNLANIIIFLTSNDKLKPLQKHYKYCKQLDGSYQGFTVNLEEKTKSITQRRELFYLNAKSNEDFNIAENIFTLKEEFLKEFTMWVSAFNIEKAYRKCFDDKSILTFSHRINGWSNPEYKLSENFTVELKTNFGYGSSSYFYIKLKYKNIDITPFSEWIDYEIAKFSEIIRYTKSFACLVLKGIYNGKRVYRKIILNTNWKDAIDFTKIACNCSLKNEEDFVRKYIIDECEKMVAGLENLFSTTKYRFKGEYETHYEVDLEGHQLMEFRGEKISGSLDFITKIFEFEGITEIKSFIFRIEESNKKIQPLLIEELKIIQAKLKVLNQELSVLKPIYTALVEKNQFYSKQKNEIRTQLLAAKELDINHLDFEKLNREFLKMFPDYTEFEKEFQSTSENYKTLTEKIQNLNILFENITNYNAKIATHFGS